MQRSLIVVKLDLLSEIDCSCALWNELYCIHVMYFMPAKTGSVLLKILPFLYIPLGFLYFITGVSYYN